MKRVMKLTSLLFGSLLVLGASASPHLNRTLGMGISNECGAVRGGVCDPRVPCCSQWGYCGPAGEPQYCGAGCQPQWSVGNACFNTPPPSCGGGVQCPANLPCCDANTLTCVNDETTCQEPNCLPADSFGSSCVVPLFCGENPQTTFTYTCSNTPGEECCTNNICGNDCINCDPNFSFPGSCVIPDDCGAGAAGAVCADPNFPCCVNGHCSAGANQCKTPQCDPQFSIPNACVIDGFCGPNPTTGYQYECATANLPCCTNNQCVSNDCGPNCVPAFSFQQTCAIPNNPCPQSFPCYNRNTGQCGSSYADCSGDNCVVSRSFSNNGQSACNPSGFCGVNPATGIAYTCPQPGNPCCSSQGFCGSVAPWCGPGCQAAFSLNGNCQGPNPQPNPPPVCGAGAGGASCPIGQCCNQAGQCSANFCGAGCQPAYSNFYCQQCGAGIGSCPTPGNPGAVCCSQYGFCGATAAYCGVGCQPLYGQCS